MGAVFDAIGRFFTAILAKVSGVLAWIGQLFVKVFEALWHFITDAFVWVFDSLLALVVVIVGGINLGDFPTLSGLFADLPSDVLNIMGLLGIADALAVIAAAILIRLTLQLVPFTRLGS